MQKALATKISTWPDAEGDELITFAFAPVEGAWCTR